MSEPKHIGEIIGEIIASVYFPDSYEILIKASSESHLEVDMDGELTNVTKVKVLVKPKSSVEFIDLTFKILPTKEK